jgi:hypothetical protein
MFLSNRPMISLFVDDIAIDKFKLKYIEVEGSMLAEIFVIRMRSEFQHLISHSLACLTAVNCIIVNFLYFIHEF